MALSLINYRHLPRGDPMKISSTFDSGNVRCLASDDPADIRLEIEIDAGDEYFQWFHYRLSGATGTPCCMRIVNAGDATQECQQFFKNYPEYYKPLQEMVKTGLT